MTKKVDQPEINVRIRAGGQRPHLSKRQWQEVIYLLRRHSTVNEESKQIAAEKVVIWNRLIQLVGLDVESIMLPSRRGQVSFHLDDSILVEEEVRASVGEEAAALIDQRHIFQFVALATLTGSFNGPTEAMQAFERLSGLLGSDWSIEEVRYGQEANERELESLCKALRVPYPSQAKKPLKRTPRWRQPIVEDKKPRRSVRLRQMIEAHLKSESAQRRR